MIQQGQHDRYDVNEYNNIRKELIINEPIDLCKLNSIIHNLDDFLRITNKQLDKSEIGRAHV